VVKICILKNYFQKSLLLRVENSQWAGSGSKIWKLSKKATPLIIQNLG